MGRFICLKCEKKHDGRWGNLTAPRAYDQFLLLAGRGGGKTLIGAHAVREELMIPGALWWAMGANHKWLWDSTFPTLVGLLDPRWIKRWDPEHVEITLHNDAKVAFRSLEDPERARGPHGVGGMWMDEAAQCPERAYIVGQPMLVKAGGIVIATTTPLGIDWTYDRIEQKALVYKEPGYWTAKWWSEHNPMFKVNPVMRHKIESARRTMSPEDFAQEYRAERTNAQGLIYGMIVRENVLADDDAIRRYLPEWPDISPNRRVVIGLDEGSDHPFGAVLMVPTPEGIIVVAEFLERMRANSIAHDEIWTKFQLQRYPEKVFAGNKNALQLRLEWALKGTGVVQAENKHEVGIQRTKSWLHSKQLKFAYTVPRTIEQMSAYRWAPNTKLSTGEKTATEQVFKLKDELPDAIRYGLMAWPELPNAELPQRSDSEQKRWDAFDDKTKREIEMMEELRKFKSERGIDLQPNKDGMGYPTGNVFQHEVTETSGLWGS